MNRFFISLNYLCIAICLLGLFATSKLMVLKPWSVQNLDSKLAEHFESRFSSTKILLAGAEQIEANPGAEVKSPAVAKVEGTPAPEVNTPEKLQPVSSPKLNVVVAKVETAPAVKPETHPAISKTPVSEPVLVENKKSETIPAKTAPVIATPPKTTPAGKQPQTVVKPVVAIAKAEPVPESKPVQSEKSLAAPKTQVPEKAAVVKEKAPAMLIAKVDAPQPNILTQNETSTNTKQTNPQTAETRKNETSKVTPEPIHPVTFPKTRISLSSMLEVDLGAAKSAVAN